MDNGFREYWNSKPHTQVGQVGGRMLLSVPSLLSWCYGSIHHPCHMTMPILYKNHPTQVELENHSVRHIAGYPISFPGSQV